jgi:small-conductance mechanosensitive channel
MDALDKATLTSGQNPISLLAIIKVVLLLVLLLWLSRVAAEAVERTLWRSKTMTPSQKVLFAKLVKIGLILLALLIGLNASGIDFTALAVFSGALGIGLGFGLQRVFSNLISGFILLMDKSIKPGDVIAVADTYGWVNHIGARHVSILTRDGKEHLVPNETLITQPVENWSYSNQNVRIHIPITVSYHEDRRLVKKLLLDVTHANTRILKDPAPTCLIEKFGERGVEFEIRAWIEDPVNGIGNVRSSIYEAVWDVFKEHGIAFPAPQRDVRITREDA